MPGRYGDSSTEPPASDRKFWWCGGKDGYGHVVGEIGFKTLQDKLKLTALLVYNTSLDSPPDDVPTVRGLVITGYDMRCTICNATFEWYPNILSLRKLLSHYTMDV